MSWRRTHPEKHGMARVGWLRAAVLGANDGIVSTASLIVGVAASDASRPAVLVAGTAALFAGAMSMAAGEFVSVSSQADTEHADLRRERRELAEQPEHEHRELADIYVQRGLDPALAATVATQLMASDALGAHARDELGITDLTRARPFQAALASACSFGAGGAAPLFASLFAPAAAILSSVAAVSIICLVLLGILGARAGGAAVTRSVVRVTFWGVAAMLVTAAVGRLFGTVI